jgi:hypothetical protein
MAADPSQIKRYAITPPLEQHIDELAEYIGRIIETPLSKPAGPVPASKRTVRKSGKGAWLWLVAAGMITMGIIAAALILGDKIPFTSKPGVETQLATSTFKFTPTFTDTIEPPTPTMTVTQEVTSTPEIVTVKMLKEKNCYETNRETSQVVYVFGPGDVVAVSGSMQFGGEGAVWFNVSQTGCRGGFEDCWILNSNIEIQGNFKQLPNPTPRPGSYFLTIAYMFITPPGVGTHTHFIAAYQSVVLILAEKYCSEQKALGYQCEYGLDGRTGWYSEEIQEWEP